MKKTDKNTEYQEFTENPQNTESCASENDTDTLTGEEPSGEEENAKVSEDDNANGDIWQDKYIRLSAEFDNFRKRTLKEKMELVSTGGENVLKEILPIVDDFERALKAMSERDDIEPEREGVRLIYQKFIDAMKTQGVTIIDALGKKMDVDYFDAVAKVPVADEEQKGVVIDVVQTGYMLKEKVLRFAKVVVGE